MPAFESENRHNTISGLALPHLLPRTRLQVSRHYQRHLRAGRGVAVGDDKRIVACGFGLLFGCSSRISGLVVIRAESLPRRSKWRCLRPHRRSPCLTCPQLGGGFTHSSKTNQVIIQLLLYYVFKNPRLVSQRTATQYHWVPTILGCLFKKCCYSGRSN